MFRPILLTFSNFTPRPIDTYREAPLGKPLSSKLGYQDIVARATQEARHLGWKEPVNRVFYSHRRGYYSVSFFHPDDYLAVDGMPHKRLFFDGTDGRLISVRAPWEGAARRSSRQTTIDLLDQMAIKKRVLVHCLEGLPELAAHHEPDPGPERRLQCGTGFNNRSDDRFTLKSTHRNQAATPTAATPIPAIRSTGGAGGRSPATAGQGALPASIVASIVGLCLLWGLGQIAIKVGNTGISPLLQAGLRSALAAVLVAAWIAFRRSGLSMRSTSRWPILAIGILFALEFVCLYQGLTMTTASRGTLLLYTAPFVVALGGHLLLDDRLDRRQWLGLLLAFAGLAVMMASRPAVTGASAIPIPPVTPTLAGDLMCLAGGVFWGATTLVIRATSLRTESPDRCLLYQLVLSAPILIGLSWLLGPTHGEFGIGKLTPMVVGALIYQVVIIAGFSYLAWFHLILRYSPGRLSAFTFLTPLFGVLLAAPLLGEPLYPGLLVALVLSMLGLALVNRAARPSAKAA